MKIKAREKVMIMKKNNKQVIDLLIDSIRDLESLENYYLVSNNAILDEIEKEQKENEYAMKCQAFFEEIWACKTQEEREAKKDEINERLFYKNKKFKDIYTITSISGKTIEYLVPQNIQNVESFFPDDAVPLLRSFRRMLSISSSSILSNEIALFERFLSRLYNHLITKKPTIYFCNQTISVQELLKTEKNTLIENEINKLVEKDMYDSIQVIRKIEEKENIALDNYEKIVKAFSEIYYRRNLFIHNDGIVNEIYLSKIEIKHNVKVGDKLNCGNEYIENSIATIQKLIFYLCFSIIAKQESKLNGDAVNVIQDFFYDMLSDEKYLFLESVYKFLSKSKQFTIDVRKSFYVNYLITLKETDKKDDLKKLVSKFLIKPNDYIYVVAKHLLLSENQEAFKIIDEHFLDDDFITANEIRKWPLFKEFRQSEYYKELSDKYPKEFETLSLEEE